MFHKCVFHQHFKGRQNWTMKRCYSCSLYLHEHNLTFPSIISTWFCMSTVANIPLERSNLLECSGGFWVQRPALRLIRYTTCSLFLPCQKPCPLSFRAVKNPSLPFVRSLIASDSWDIVRVRKIPNTSFDTRNTSASSTYLTRTLFSV